MHLGFTSKNHILNTGFYGVFIGFLRFLYGFLRVFEHLVFWGAVRILVFTGSIYGFLRVDFNVFTSKIRVFTGSPGSPNQKTQKKCFKIYMNPQNSKEK